MRYLILSLSLLSFPLAAEEPEHMSNYVYVHDLAEHKIVVAAPYGFTDSQRGASNLYSWADWTCQLYQRRAVGPLNQRQASTDACGIINVMTHPQAINPRPLTQADRDACQIFHLFACAIR